MLKIKIMLFRKWIVCDNLYQYLIFQLICTFRTGTSQCVIHVLKSCYPDTQVKFPFWLGLNVILHMLYEINLSLTFVLCKCFHTFILWNNYNWNWTVHMDEDEKTNHEAIYIFLRFSYIYLVINRNKSHFLSRIKLSLWQKF